MTALISRLSRSPVYRCLAFSALFIVLVATTYRLRSFDQRGVTYTPAANLPIAHVPANRFGVNAKLEDDVTVDQLRRDFEAIHAAGFGWVRIEVEWNQLEPDAPGLFWDAKFGQSSWDKWDRIVAFARDYNVRIIARIDRPPLWSHPQLENTLLQHPDWQGPPADMNTYGDIVAAFVGRYHDNVHEIQVWNEPNLQNEWAGQKVNPAQYADMLHVAADRARAIDPNAVILAASLAPNVEPGPTGGTDNMSDLLYLQRLYQAQASPYFDVVMANPYGLQYSPTADRSIGFHSYQFPRAALRPPESFDFSRPIAMRAIMERNGDEGKPIWAGEFGWNTVPKDWQGNKSPWKSVTVQQQALYTVDAFQRARAEWPWMGVMNVWYLREPVDTDPRDPTPYFAIVHQDWSVTPAYNAIRALAAQPARDSTGVNPAGSSNAQYGFDGAWRTERSTTGPWTYQVAGAPEATVRYQFEGSTLSLVVRTAPNGGNAFVQIDGDPHLANALPTDAQGDAVLDLYSPKANDGVRRAVASDLPDGPHQLVIVIKGAREPAATGTDLAISSFVIGRLPWPGWTYLLALEAIGLAACAAWPVTLVAKFAWRPSRDRTERLVAMLHRHQALVFSAMLASATLYYLAPRVSLAALFLAALLALALVRLDLALLLVAPAATLAFLPKTLAGHQIEPAETAIIVCAVAWIVRGYWRGVLELVWGGFSWNAAALVAIAVASLLVSAYLRYSLRELRLVIVEPVLWFVMARSLIASHQRWLLADAVIATGAAVAIVGLIGFALGHSVITTEGVRRLASVYPSPDNLGLLLDRIVPVAAGVALFGLGRRRLWYGGAAIPMLLAALLTFSKGSWLALAAAGLVLGIRHRTVAVASAIAIVALAGAAIALPVTRVRLLGATSMERVWLWQSALTMIRDHPVFGIGLDQFLYTYPKYRLPTAWREPFLSHPHNMVLEVWLNFGLAGLAWLGWTGYRIFERLRLLAVGGERDERALVAGVGAGFAAALVHGMVDNAFFLPDLAILFWAFLVLLDGPMSKPVPLPAALPAPILEDRLVTVR